ncbi:MAG: SLBB domain-containing protein [Desulfosudis oleivorans]|nr:SLBB domain-containing protein [Desulfosudis oleivorans]
MYELVGPTTLLQAIAQAGRTDGPGHERDLRLQDRDRTASRTRIVISPEDLMTDGNPELNIELQPKDVVTIPIDQTLNVFVYGEVRTPGVIPYLSSKKITLLQAIAQAGGTTEWAKKSKVVIKRKDKRDRQRDEDHRSI